MNDNKIMSRFAASILSDSKVTIRLSKHFERITMVQWRIAFACWLCAMMLSANVSSALTDEDYLLGGGDTVNITVYEQPDLTTKARISQDSGTIVFPLLGEVALAGLSPTEAGSKIEKLLSSGGYIKAPQVSVTVQEFFSQKIPVMGEVNSPGEYPLKGESRVVDLVSQAGGLRAAAADVIIVVRNEDGQSVRHEIDLLSFYAGDMSQNIKVSGGDFILVPKMDTFYIHGEVQRPGMYRLERDMTVMQALSVAGGISERGSHRGMKATRRDADGKTHKVGVELTDHLQPNDVLYVKERLF